MVGPEAKLYKKIKKQTPTILWNRIENLSIPGMPDALCYNKNKIFFTVEFKTTKANKLRFSAHQIAWHLQHPKNTFILAESHGQGCLKLYEGSQIRELVTSGLTLAACSSRSLALEAWRLTLAACRSVLPRSFHSLHCFGLYQIISAGHMRYSLQPDPSRTYSLRIRYLV